MSAPKYKFTLDSDAAEFAEKNLGETEEKREKCLNAVRDWLRENPNLNARSDDLSLLAFLRACKFDLERTKKKLSNYQIMKAQTPQWFSGRDPEREEIKELARLGVFVPLRKVGLPVWNIEISGQQFETFQRFPTNRLGCASQPASRLSRNSITYWGPENIERDPANPSSRTTDSW